MQHTRFIPSRLGYGCHYANMTESIKYKNAKMNEKMIQTLHRYSPHLVYTVYIFGYDCRNYHRQNTNGASATKQNTELQDYIGSLHAEDHTSVTFATFITGILDGNNKTSGTHTS